MGILISYQKIVLAIVIFSALVNSVLGGLVFLDSPRRKVNRLFSLLSILLAIWNITLVFVVLSSSPSLVAVWKWVYSSAFCFVSPLYFHLVLGSIGDTSKGRGSGIPPIFNRVKQLAYLIWVGMVALGANRFSMDSERVTVLNDFSMVFVFFALFNTVGMFLLTKQFFKTTEPNPQTRLFYLLNVGGGLLLIGSILYLASFSFAHPFSLWMVGLAHLISTPCLILAAYALTTSQLYHFSELARKTMAFVALTLILLVVFGSTHMLSRQFLLPYIPQSDFLALGLASIIMALVFHPLRFRVQNVVDRVFFSQRYDQMERLRGLSRRVLSSADRDELLNVLFSSLKGVGFGSITLLLKDPQKSVFTIKKSLGLSQQSDGFFLKNDSLLIQYLSEEKRELVREDVTRRILTDWERQSLMDEMDVLHAEISFPLFSTRRRALFGVITLGNSELGYSSFLGRNIFWLKSVIDNSGIMLDNFYHHEFANALIPYVGRTWADEMRKNKEGFRERLTGHRTWVTILMVDIRHFTTLSARMDPRHVVEFLREFRSQVAPVVYKYQGTIDKFIGDAIMIVFGLPILPALPNPDLNAVQCAEEIRQVIRGLNLSKFDPKIGENVSIGIGVSSGEVIAGNVDSGDRVEYTVIGDAPNMVARLEDLAGDNQILMSPGTYQKVNESVDVNEWEPRLLTGFPKPVPIYEFLKFKTTSSPSSDSQPSEIKPLTAKSDS